MASGAPVAGSGWRIAFDVGPVRARSTGVGVYARSVCGALAEEIPDQLSLIGVRREVAHDGGLPTSVPRRPFGSGPYQRWLQTRADRDARRSGARLVHFTNAAAPIWATMPFVLTVHDLSLMVMPNYHPPLRLATLPVTLAAIARAKAIVVPSRSTARELGRVLRVRGDRVVVVEHAPSPAAGTHAHDSDESDLRRLGIHRGPYVLSVGTLEPRKNHRRLIGAFERLAAHDADLRLVIVGDDGWRSSPIHRRVLESPVRDRIVLPGFVPADELATLICGAAAVCYVSLYEGYGLPVIEAMATGAAVVTSRLSSMPEAAGGAAVLVDPFDEADIARGISEAVLRRPELVAAGLARAGRRTWHDVALETIDVYRWAMRAQEA